MVPAYSDIALFAGTTEAVNASTFVK
jgi:hypothetical protein